jgi:ankyrin repeat protein
MKARRSPAVVDRLFGRLVRAVVEGETQVLSWMLRLNPELARAKAGTGATRQQASAYFFFSIAHYMYAGDTALHMAAAAGECRAVELLIRAGADCRARNRRGAEPLHYAADGHRRKPGTQKKVIELLISGGADPNTTDKSGVAPLHRAVRTRASEAVGALLAGAAIVNLKNGRGSTPLHLAVQDTGKRGAGSAPARHEQEKIIAMLLGAGARAADRDLRGKSVLEAAANERVRMLLARR